MVKTRGFDDAQDKPNGWHWFWGIYCLEYYPDLPDPSDLSQLEIIYAEVTDEHWFKWTDDSHLEKIYADTEKAGLQEAISELLGSLKIAKRLTSDPIYFSGKKFDATVDFSSFIFPTKVIFQDVQFLDNVDFSNTLFLENVYFNDAKFFHDASFKKAKFFENAYFNGAEFYETADFEDATFQSEKSYRKETAKFRNTIFEKIANFRNATFWGYANFKGAELKGRAFFQKAKFEWHAPRFYDATFNNEMTWAGIELPKFSEAKVDRHTKVDGEFILISDRKLIEQNRRRRIEENQNSYENTAILLAGRKKFHDEHLFFRHEMGCRRELEKNKFICLSFWLYEILADYGYGIECAIKAWLWHVAIGAVAISIIASSGGVETWQHLSCSVSVSIANANPFVFVIIKDGSLIDCYKCLQDISPLSFGAIRGVQTFIGVTLLFLLLTTLRVRFRLKITNH